MSKEREYKIENIIRAVTANTWLCEPSKLDEMRAFLELRAAGERLDEETVRGAFLPMEGSEVFQDEEGRAIDVDGIRYLQLFGVMAPRMNLMMRLSGGTSTHNLNKSFRAALSDESVKTILMHVDSPGGVATAIPELGQLIRENRKKKRIVVVAEGLMASGALWVGTAGTSVHATLSTGVGSQGAFRIVRTSVKRDTDEGFKFHVIRAGEFKALGMEHEELSDKGREVFQDHIEELNDMFISEVALNRGVSPETVRKKFGRGRVFSANEAVDRGMIDSVITFEELLDRERRRNARATSISVPGGRSMTVSSKVKAALYACDCIDSMEVSDDVCVAYLRGLGKSTDVNVEEASDEDLIKLINAESSKLPFAKLKESTLGIDANGNEYETITVDPDRFVPREQAQAEHRARVAEIRLCGREFNVTDEKVMEAISSAKALDEIRQEFVQFAEQHDGPVSIRAGDAQLDKVNMAVSAAILDRLGMYSLISDDERQYAVSMQDTSMIEMARKCLTTAGIRESGDRGLDARRWLAMGMPGVGQQNAKKLMYGYGGLVAEPSVNRRGDHPDALSNLMGRILDDAYEQAPRTFEIYTKRAPDVPDTRPKTFLEAGIFQELDAMGEDEKHKQLKFKSALKAMIQVAKYGNKVALTEEMVIDDDLSIFDQQLASLQEAVTNTVDNSCRTLLVSNPTMMDGVKMWDATRGNIASGAPPNATSAAEHRKLHRLIKGFDSTRPINRAPDTSLHPADQEEAVRQTFMFNASDPKVAQADGNINTVRGTLTPHHDAMLDGYPGGDKPWWTFVSRLKPLLITYLRGKGGPAGSRTTWIDPDTGSRYIAVDLWAGYAALNWRGVVYNPGQ